MRIELITTGSELLLGFTLNTHVQYIARRLGERGCRLARQTTVGDDRAEMRAVVAEALQRSDLILITGGLGPTRDDFTRDVVAELLDRPLHRDESVVAHIRERYRQRGVPLREEILVQALVPHGATVLPNPNGTAPGLYLEQAGKQIYLLPGPPRELYPMLDRLPLPRRPNVDCRLLKVARVPESVVEARVEAALAGLTELELGYCARMGEVDVRIVAPPAIAAQAEQRIRAALGDDVFGAGADRLEEVVLRQLAAAGQTLATAESCTGGLIAHRLTNVSGSSAVFLSGLVTYSNESKIRWLGVSPATLQSHGAVSQEVCRQMAEGARRYADWAVAVTGIAGPTGGTAEKPVGLVYLAVAGPDDVTVEKHHFPLDRETFKQVVSTYALDALRRRAAAAR
jgi:nicotinamide-nucleotide amidase